MTRYQIFSCLVGLLTAVCCASNGRAETAPKWTDTTGNFSIVAEFVQLENDEIVVLRKTNGTEVRVPLTKLSGPSRVQARKAAKAMGGSVASSGSSETGAIANSPGVPFPEGMTCEQTVRYLADESEKGNYRVLFDSLPAKYQTDASDVIRLAGKQMDPKLFSEIESTSNRLVQTLRSKKSFVLGCPMLEQYSDSKYIPVYDAGVNVIAAVLATKIINPRNMQSSDHSAIIGAYLKGLVPAGEKLISAMEDAGLEQMMSNQMGDFKNNRFSTDSKNQKFTVEPLSETTANVVTEINGNSNQKVTQTWHRIDGRWVTASAENWEQNIQKSKESLTALSPEAQAMALEQLKSFNTQFLSKFEAVKSQQEFDAAVVQIVMMAGPMMQQMGGGGMPGGGLPGDTAPPPAFFGTEPSSSIE